MPENPKCCEDHGGRAKCPKNYPNMCARKNDCAGGTEYCCHKTPEKCDGDKGGLRACNGNISVSEIKHASAI